MEESTTTAREDTTRSKPKLRHRLETEAYPEQKKRWPKHGKFILAQYTRTGPSPLPFRLELLYFFSALHRGQLTLDGPTTTRA